MCHYPLLSFSVASLRGTSPELPVSFAIRQYPVFFFSPSTLSLSQSRPRPTRIRYASSYRRVCHPFSLIIFQLLRFLPSPLRNRRPAPCAPCCAYRRKISKVGGKNFESQRGTISSGIPVEILWLVGFASSFRQRSRALRDVSPLSDRLCPRGFAISNP